MARWKLLTPHYLMIEGVTWQYKEVDRMTGKLKTQTFKVPHLLDPIDPTAWNYVFGRDNGEIIVCLPGKGEARDIEFFDSNGGPGTPTPDMFPVDDEAKAISAKLEEGWKHPIESLSGTYSNHLLAGLHEEIAKVQSQSAPATTTVEGLSELLAAMTTMMKQNQQMLDAMVSAKAPAAALRR